MYALAVPVVVCCARMVRCQLNRALSGCGVDVRVFCVQACYTFLGMLCGVFGVSYWLVGISYSVVLASLLASQQHIRALGEKYFAIKSY